MENLKNVIFDEKILIFDLDGTLIETDEANLLAYNEAIEKVKKINLLSHYPNNKRFTSRELNQLFPVLDTNEYDEIINKKNVAYLKYLDKTFVNKKLLNIINSYSKTNTLILATKSSQKRADLILKYHGLEDCFDYKFYNENYASNNKFKYIFEQLKIDPILAIVFENEIQEVELAKFAKIQEKNIIHISKGE